MKFLAEKSEIATSPMTDAAFLKEFNSSEGNYTTENSLHKRIRKTAVVEVDEYQRITKYKANNGSLELKGKCGLIPKKEWTKPETDKLEMFIAEKSKKTDVPLSIRSLSREFSGKNGVSRTVKAVSQHIHKHLLPNMSKLDKFDTETRMRMMFTLSVPVDEEFLKELRKKAIVEVDEHRKITKYEANDEILKLETQRISPFTVWSNEEKEKLLNFIVEKSKKTKLPLLFKQLCGEFAKKSGISRTTNAVHDYIRLNVFTKISKLNDFDIETRMRMLFALRKEAVVKIDEKRRIITYKANNGSLELKGDHSLSAKKKTMYAQKKSRSRVSEFSENGEETEDDKDDEEEGVKEKVSKSNTRSGRLSKQQLPDNNFFSDSDDNSFESSEKIKKPKNKRTEKVTRKPKNSYFSETEDEESEEEYEKEESESNSSTRRSGRISKERYSDVDFSFEFDDVAFDSPKSVEIETEEPVAISSNSSSIASIVKNQKRKIVENPSDATSSSKKSRKYERDADTQNGIETENIAREPMENDGREAICDDPGKLPCPDESPIEQESFPNKKVKLENEEYKPDRSFLSNTNQNQMQNFPVVDGIHTDNVEHATESIEELTSRKEFMKSLGSLVHTLDSPILFELQAKIEKSIKEIGDGNHKIPTDEIARTLESGLLILNKNAAMKLPTREYTSLRDFFLILRTTLSTFRSSSLNNFQLKLKESAKKLNDQDKYILLDIIGTVLETLFLLVSP